MSACLTEAELSHLAAGERPRPEQTDHLVTCAKCCERLRGALQATDPGASTEVSAASRGPARDEAPLPTEPAGRFERRAKPDGTPEVLGVGGFARVVLAFDHVLGRDVALKQIRTKHLTSDRAALIEQRLLQEARIVGQLEHPGIVALHDVARTADQRLFSVMRRIRGRTLHDVVKSTRTLEERLRLLPHVLAACNAIAYAHSRGVVHRDLKPGNVMVDRYGETLVIDWGLARAASQGAELEAPSVESSGALRLVPEDETISDGKGRVGTPAYMSPEQLTGVRALIDEKSDVWGLGAILFEVLTGKAPRESGPLQAPPPRARTLEPELPEELAAICDKALETSREQRYQDAETLARDLDAWLHGRRVTAYAYRPSELFGRFLRRHRIAVTVGAAALATLAVLAVVTTLRVREERNQARALALFLVDDVFDRLRMAQDDELSARVTSRVSEYLARSPGQGDGVDAAWTWSRLVDSLEVARAGADVTKAAEQCLRVVEQAGRSDDPRLIAARMQCRLSLLVTDNALSQLQVYEQLKGLEAQSPRTSVDPVLLRARTSLLIELTSQANNAGNLEESAAWAHEAWTLAEQLETLAPDDEVTWSLAVSTTFGRMVIALNGNDFPEAVRWAERQVVAARRGHALGRSVRSLARLCNSLESLRVAQRYAEDDISPRVAAASRDEAMRAYDALLLMRNDDPEVRRTYGVYLDTEGLPDRAWELIKDLPTRMRFDLLRDSLYVGLMSDHPDWVVKVMRSDVTDLEGLDQHVLLAFALAQLGQRAEAAAEAKKAAGYTFVSALPVRTFGAWGAKHPGLIATAAAALDAAQLHTDSEAATKALEAFAAALLADPHLP